MSISRQGVVFNTDREWFLHFRPDDMQIVVDEVNFWRPRAQTQFRAIPEGGPFYFRLKSPINAIAGYGFFALQTLVPVPIAWELFGAKNGDSNYLSFRRRIADYRKLSVEQLSDPLSCLVLREITFLPSSQWIPWTSNENWSPNLMAYKTYDLDSQPGVLLQHLLSGTGHRELRELSPEYELVPPGSRSTALRNVGVREGQGTFRARLLQVYGRQCAATGEKSLPALEAAHIQPYQNPASNHVQNGMLLRADFHRLYDTGYLTVTPDYTLEVSRRMRDDFDNGEAYYRMRGTRIRVPDANELQPSKFALDWHNNNIYLG